MTGQYEMIGSTVFLYAGWVFFRGGVVTERSRASVISLFTTGEMLLSLTSVLASSISGGDEATENATSRAGQIGAILSLVLV